MTTGSKVLKDGERPLPPNAGKGRVPGVPNRTTAVLKEAILLAAEQTGSDGRGKGGLVGYLRRVAAKDVKAFAMLLGKVLPLQVTGPGGGPIAAVTMTPAEYEAATRSAMSKLLGREEVDEPQP